MPFIAATALVFTLIMVQVFVDGVDFIALAGSIGFGVRDVLLATGLSVGAILVALTVGILMLVVIFGERFAADDDTDDTVLGRWALYIQAAGVTLFVGALWVTFGFGGLVGLAMDWWFVAPLLLFGYVVMLYFDARRTRATTTSALDQTQRSVRRQVSSKSEAATGVVVLGFTVAAALVTGLFAGLSGIGDVLLMFAGEFAYLVITGVGFIQIGGSLPGSSFVPNLTARQFAAAALLLGAVAIMVSEDR